MNLKLNRRYGDDSGPPPRNDDWIFDNIRDTNEWINKNDHLFGNNKPSVDKVEIFYNVSDACLFLAVRYPNWAKMGNVSEPISFNESPHQFVANREKVMMVMKSLKNAFKRVPEHVKAPINYNPGDWL